MNRSVKITLIIILSLLIITLISFMIGVIVFGYDYNFNISSYELVKKEEYKLSDIDKININTTSANIEFYESDSDSIIIEQYSSKKIEEKELFTYNISGKNFNIKDGKQRRFLYIFSFGFRGWFYKIYLPKDYQEEVIVKTVSGDIVLHDNVNDLNNLSMTTTSGDISVEENLKTKKLSIRTVSGDVKLSTVNAVNTEIKTTSGDIIVNSITNDSYIKSISGDIEINQLEGNIKLITTSGDVEIDKFHMKNASSIKTVSGEVDVNFTKDTNYEVITKTISGDVSLPSDSSINGNSPYNKLNIKTTSGDIEIKKN